jgi:hypothetical protein
MVYPEEGSLLKHRHVCFQGKHGILKISFEIKIHLLY